MLRRQFTSGHFLGKIICHCFIFREDDCPVLRRQFAGAHFFKKTIVHCLIFREDNCPLLRRQLYSAQFMVKITVFREDNHPVLHLHRRQSASASYFEKTIVLVLKKTILLEKTILPFPKATACWSSLQGVRSLLIGVPGINLAKPRLSIDCFKQLNWRLFY